MTDTPDPLPPADELDALELEALGRAVAEADEAVARGRVVPHERVRAWLLDLAHGRRTPRPEPE